MSIATGDDADTVGNIEKFLQQCLEGMEPDHTVKGVGRPRILPAMALWAGLLVCVLRGFGSQLAVWRLISERQLWFFLLKQALQTHPFQLSDIAFPFGPL